MNDEFRITGFYNVLKTRNETNESFYMENRYASAFVILLSGTIRFSPPGREALLCDPKHPVYLPQGISYKNECLAAADGLLFNFFDNGAQKIPLNLHPVRAENARDFFARAEQIVFPEQSRDFERLSLLYALAAILCSTDDAVFSPLLIRAVQSMTARFGDPNLKISQIAAEIPVSEVYLRRLFLKYLGNSPHRYLTGLRMEKAKTYLLENRTVTETAELCGYADIYSFSRAFRQYYGHSPTISR